ncbi:hypothetical protein ELG09_01985 [Neisseria gonorrhoeae]
MFQVWKNADYSGKRAALIFCFAEARRRQGAGLPYAFIKCVQTDASGFQYARARCRLVRRHRRQRPISRGTPVPGIFKGSAVRRFPAARLQTSSPARPLDKVRS